MALGRRGEGAKEREECELTSLDHFDGLKEDGLEKLKSWEMKFEMLMLFGKEEKKKEEGERRDEKTKRGKERPGK